MTAIAISRRRLASLLGTALALPAFAEARHAAAQGAGKAMRVILPVGPGSGVDTSVRIAGNALSKALGQHVVIENLPGVGGITGTAALVRAPADGQTIGIVSTNHVVNPSVYRNVPFDAIADITPIAVIGATPFVLLAHPSVPATSLPELVALARAKPGALNYGSSGNGTILHLAGEMLVAEAGIRLQHVPYKAAGQMLQDLIGGQIQLGFFAISVAASHIKSGALRGLGVASTSRAAMMPELPTLAEQGVPNYSVDGWWAAIGPKGLPDAEVRRINKAIKQAHAAPEVRDALVAQGNMLNVTTAEVAAQFFRSELAKYARLVKQAGIALE
jgi:tripartite-type tricarboxylate transporter receptor subunit TctC